MNGATVFMASFLETLPFENLAVFRITNSAHDLLCSIWRNAFIET